MRRCIKSVSYVQLYNINFIMIINSVYKCVHACMGVSYIYSYRYVAIYRRMHQICVTSAKLKLLGNSSDAYNLQKL